MSQASRARLAWPLALVLTLATSAQEPARTSRLSGPLPRGHAGDVNGFLVSADERWIVFHGDQTQHDRFELYSVPSDGSAPARPLCGTLATGDQVSGPWLTPDGQGVVFAVQGGVRRERGRLYRAPIDGSAPPRLLYETPVHHAALLAPLEISSDSRFVLFQVSPTQGGGYEVLTQRLDGSAPASVLDSSPSFRGITARFSADGSRVVFARLLDPPLQSGAALFSTPTEGGPVVRLDPPALPFSNVSEYRVAGDRIAFLLDATVDQRPELFSVPADGSASAIRLSPPSDGVASLSDLKVDASGEWVLARRFLGANQPTQLISLRTDGSTADVRLDVGTGVSFFTSITATGRVIFAARVPGLSAGTSLFSAPIDGSAPAVRLSFGPVNSTVIAFEVSPDGRDLTYTRTGASQFTDLFVTRTDGSAPELHLDRDPFDVRVVTSLEVGSTWAAYVGRDSSAGPSQLYAVPLDGHTPPVPLHLQISPSAALPDHLALVGSQVVHLADLTEKGVRELCIAPADGSAPATSLSGPGALGAVGDVIRFEVAGRRAIYLADQETDGVDELFSAELDLPGNWRRLNDPLGAGDAVTEFRLTPDRRSVVFTARVAGRKSLFVAPCDGSAPARKLDGVSTSTNGVGDFEIAPDGRKVVYDSDQRGTFFDDLYVVPLDGSAPERSLLFHARSFHRIRISPDSRSVAFRLGNELYSLSLDDASVPPRRISTTGFMGSIAVSGDSRHAVLRADRLGTRRFLLYSWPLTGAGPLIPLMPQGTGGLDDFAVVPGSGRIVFRANLPGGRKDLRSVLADGSAEPVALATLSPGRMVRDFQVSPDGSRVLYRADALTDDRYELFSVPVDGSQPAVRLSYASRRDTDVPVYAFTPDSRAVLFLADTLRNEQDDLYVVPADRSQPPRRLNPSLAPHGTLFDFRCSPDGAFVAYRANHRDPSCVELWRMPLAGGVPQRFSGDPAPNGDVRSYRFASPDELVYDGDLAEDQAFELYLGRLEPQRRTFGSLRPRR